MNMTRGALALLMQITPQSLKKTLRTLMPARYYRALARRINGTRSALDVLRDSSPGCKVPANTSIADLAQKLEDRLWGGHATRAAEDLEAIRLDPATDPTGKVTAARALARYYTANQAHEKALALLAFIRSVDPEYKRNARILEIHCLLQLGRTDEARTLIERTLKDGNPADGCMNAALASAALLDARKGLITEQEAAQHYLEHMSRPLRAGGHVGLRLRDPGRPLALDNLAPDIEPPIPESMPVKVSVLMAVYNGAENLEPAVRSVLDQTWRNLEFVIVDDASTDESWELIQRFAREDDRIIPLRHAKNGGAYVARNTALEHASGDYVVVNDADDWAHPQKIEAQVAHLLKYRNVIGNMTFRVRVAPDMTVLPRLDSAHVPIIHNDYSALMLSRERALELGGWDAVRFSADAEFVERLCAIEGKQAMQRIRGGMPLSISLWNSNNLTTSSSTSIWTNRFGSRLEYVRHFREWHASGQNLKTRRTSQLHPFPVPGICYAKKGLRQKFDAVLVIDTGADVNGREINMKLMTALHGPDKRIGLLPWPAYDLVQDRVAETELTCLARKLGVIPVVHGEQVECNLVLIHPPQLLLGVPERLPELHSGRVIMLSEPHAFTRSGRKAVECAAAKVFNQPTQWQSASEVLRRLEGMDSFTESRKTTLFGPFDSDAASDRRRL